eukprot:jgi/Ulvmu1/2740/UM014_0197.1
MSISAAAADPGFCGLEQNPTMSEVCSVRLTALQQLASSQDGDLFNGKHLGTTKQNVDSMQRLALCVGNNKTSADGRRCALPPRPKTARGRAMIPDAQLLHSSGIQRSKSEPRSRQKDMTAAVEAAVERAESSASFSSNTGPTTVCKSTSTVPPDRVPARPVLLKMPPQTSRTQWGYAHIWQQGQPYPRSRSRTATVGTCNKKDSRLGRTTSALWLGGRTSGTSAAVLPSVTYPAKLPVDKCCGTRATSKGPGRSVSNIKDGSAGLHSEQNVYHNAGMYDTIGSGIARKIPATGEYHGQGRFTSAVKE